MVDDLNPPAFTDETSLLAAETEEEPGVSPGVAFIETLAVLIQRKWLIAAVTGMGLLIGLAVSLLLPVRYTATAKIMTPQQNQSLASLLLMNQMANSGSGSLAAAASGGLSLRNPNDLYIGSFELTARRRRNHPKARSCRGLSRQEPRHGAKDAGGKHEYAIGKERLDRDFGGRS